MHDFSFSTKNTTPIPLKKAQKNGYDFHHKPSKAKNLMMERQNFFVSPLCCIVIPQVFIGVCNKKQDSKRYEMHNDNFQIMHRICVQ